MLVKAYNDKARAGTYLIAKGFEREHSHLLKLINKYKEDFEEFSDLESEKCKSTGGRPIKEYLLDEDQVMFLGMLLRNSDVIVSFKKKIAKAFKKTREELIAIKKQHNKQECVMSRDFGKENRLKETDAIQKFIQYAKDQGGSEKGCDKYYSNITKMMNGLLFIVEGKFKTLRDVMTPSQLMTVATAERIITKSIEKGIKNKMFYKDIYKEVKKDVAVFALLHGKSEVITNLLGEP